MQAKARRKYFLLCLLQSLVIKKCGISILLCRFLILTGAECVLQERWWWEVTHRPTASVCRDQLLHPHHMAGLSQWWKMTQLCARCHLHGLDIGGITGVPLPSHNCLSISFSARPAVVRANAMHTRAGRKEHPLWEALKAAAPLLPELTTHLLNGLCNLRVHHAWWKRGGCLKVSFWFYFLHQAGNSKQSHYLEEHDLVSSIGNLAF